MAITINGNGTLTGVTSGAGKILNVWQQIKTDPQTVANQTFVDISGLSVTLTPASSSSTFLILYHLGCVGSVSSGPLVTQILRNTTAIGNGTGGTLNCNAAHYLANNILCTPSSGYYLDSPATTSQIVYKLQMASDGATAHLNRRQSDQFFRSASTFTVMEIG